MNGKSAPETPNHNVLLDLVDSLQYNQSTGAYNRKAGPDLERHRIREGGLMPRQAIGILTSGGDCPGLNAAIRAAGKAARDHFGMEVIGFQDGFRGLVENRSVRLEGETLSGIITWAARSWVPAVTNRIRFRWDHPDTWIWSTSRWIITNTHLDALICLGGRRLHRRTLAG